MGLFDVIGLSSGQSDTMDRVLNLGGAGEGAGEVSTTEKKYAKLQQPQNEVKQLVYPSNLLKSDSGHGHFVLININKISGSMFSSKATRVENGGSIDSPYASPVVNGNRANSIRKHMGIQHVRTEESIALPMPDELVTNYGVIWNARELGATGQLLRSAVNMDNMNLKDVSNALSEESKKLVTGAIQTLTPLNTQDAAELHTGTRSNPFVEVLFNGTTNREQPLQFKFTPRTPEESLTVREIIRRLKFHMYPEFKFKQHDSSYMLHPSIFDLTFMVMKDNEGVRNPWLHRLSTCALTNCQVNYTSEGGYNIHDDDAPVTIVVDCTFVELEQLHKGRFEYGDSF
ncbi:hypothetical protein MYOV003v1_p0216 [Vibrio phage 207E48.1]|nr:hypothetical protein MYOV003v1_p0216 [Vibrio phage 207E48.1]